MEQNNDHVVKGASSGRQDRRRSEYVISRAMVMILG
jgi:hypothetical protein